MVMVGKHYKMVAKCKVLNINITKYLNKLIDVDLRGGKHIYSGVNTSRRLFNGDSKDKRSITIDIGVSERELWKIAEHALDMDIRKIIRASVREYLRVRGLYEVTDEVMNK